MRAQEARRVLEEEAARRLGLVFSPRPPLGEDPSAILLFPGGNPRSTESTGARSWAAPSAARQ